MTMQTTGIHHITAFARDPQQNVDFYAGILGLRLVKRTINFDAPEVYHLYFGDQAGSPGTIITFFPWPGSRQGVRGGGQVGVTTFVVPPGSLEFWAKRLEGHGIIATRTTRFQETFLEFQDNEGLYLELVERETGANSAWSFGGIPADKAIQGFGGVVLFSVNPMQTIRVLEEVLGLEKAMEDADYARFHASAALGNRIDVSLVTREWGHGGAGTVHHIAWRSKDFDEQEQWRNIVHDHGLQPTQILDRQYFKSIYFRENGGILFEIATDPPGFARDEAPEALGERLMLPAWFESKRSEIEANLLPIEVRVLDGDKQ